MLEERKVGDREPIRETAVYPAAVQIDTADITFWMRALGAPEGEYKVAGEVAAVVDISVASGAAAGTVWEYAYPLAAVDVDTPGRYAAWFRADYGAEEYRFAPNTGEVILVSITGPASTAGA